VPGADAAHRRPGRQRHRVRAETEGAAVIDLITASSQTFFGFAGPMPRDVASRRRGGRVRQPLQRIAGDSLSAISPLDGDKTIDLCNGGDSCAPTATTSVSYRVYVEGGMARQAAAFVALRLSAPSPGSGAAHSSPCTDASVTLTCTAGFVLVARRWGRLWPAALGRVRT